MLNARLRTPLIDVDRTEPDELALLVSEAAIADEPPAGSGLRARDFGGWWQYIGSTFFRESRMSRLKNETLTLRTTAEIKSLLRQAAEREHRSLASMVEVLVLEYADGHQLKPGGTAADRQSARR